MRIYSEKADYDAWHGVIGRAMGMGIDLSEMVPQYVQVHGESPASRTYRFYLSNGTMIEEGREMLQISWQPGYLLTTEL